jgi:exonuclease SbcC
MIPVKLELTNFLSYRDTAVVDFVDIHLACVAGANGAGKSSIMDGITWALFGQSRSRSDDDLVNRIAAKNDDTAEVRFTFELEGVTYRIIRRKRVGKTGVLELQMADGAGGWRPLSESRLRETQAAIEQLLRMNYETFINASFLLQGKADEFTTRTDSQRKQILAELLGATQWEQYRMAAAETRKTAEGAETLIDGRLQEILTELGEEDARQEALAAAQAQQQAIAEKLHLREELLQQMRQTAAALEQLRKTATAQKTAVARAERSLAQAQETLAARRKEKASWDALLAEKEHINADFAQWQQADALVQGQQALANHHNQLLGQMKPLEIAISRAQSGLEAQRKGLLERAAQAVQAQEEREALAAQISALETRQADLQEESTRLAGLEEALSEARARLQQTMGERALREKELAGLQAQARQMDKVAADKSALQKTQEEATLLIHDLEERVEAIGAQRNHVAELKAEKEALSSRQPGLREKIDELKERLDQLREVDADGVCPTCGQSLGGGHLENALENIQRDGKVNADLYRANLKRLAAIEVELPQIEKTMAQGQRLEAELMKQQKVVAQAAARLEELARQEAAWADGGQEQLINAAAVLADKSTLEAQTTEVETLIKAVTNKKQVQQALRAAQQAYAEAKARLGELERIVGTWAAEGESQLTAVSKQLASGAFATDEKQQLAALQEQLDIVGYDGSAHQAALAAREALSAAPERRQTLQRAEAALESLQTTLVDLSQQIAQQEADLAEQRREQEENEAQIALLAESSATLPELETEVFRLREEEIAATGQVGRAQQSVAVLDTLRVQRDALQTEKEQLALRVRRLKVLETSCGRKGVQALLIEQALPEIEDRANDLLERLTGGDMRVRFDTQRQKKSGDAMLETLDIVIEDRSGQRPYENYSGGEQFRINFAIRLALSQLLTHRTGARLQTLVIDEGFGSQDPLGRQRLIEAINAVQDDFACILVITHIDELREAFPTRIEVQKELNGSQITIF